MELSLDVNQIYRGKCSGHTRHWHQDYDEAVTTQMNHYIEKGIVRLREDNEPIYGYTPLNIVCAPGERLRITMDAREVNTFFAPPRVELPNVL